jgi:hypothetical protein
MVPAGYFVSRSDLWRWKTGPTPKGFVSAPVPPLELFSRCLLNKSHHFSANGPLPARASTYEGGRGCLDNDGDLGSRNAVR